MRFFRVLGNEMGVSFPKIDIQARNCWLINWLSAPFGHGVEVGWAIADVDEGGGVGMSFLEEIADDGNFVFLGHEKIDAGGALVVIIGESGGENVGKIGGDGGLVEENFDAGAEDNVVDGIGLHALQELGDAGVEFEGRGAEGEIVVGEAEIVFAQN